ncbi:MAG TPA: hypothetical protein VMY42_19340, partial [Thermoguttaceae bacterium]|nr:hypothetical protein [Thermoguttaceae bacterium]
MMLESFLNLLCRHRKATFLAGSAVLAAAAILATRLSLNDSPERWLPASSVADWDRFAKHYEYADTIAIGLQFHREVRDDDLPFLEAFRDDLLAVDGIKQVIDVSLVADGIEDVPISVLLRLPEDPENDPYDLYRGILFDDERLWRSETATDGRRDAGGEGRTLLDFVLLETGTTEGLDPPGRQAEIDARRRRVVSGVYGVIEKHKQHHRDVTFHVVGGIVIQHELEHIARRLVLTVLPLSLLLTLLALGIGFRSPAAVAIAVFGGAWSVVVMLGGVALAGWTLNVVTVGGPTLMAVIVVATTVHFAHHGSLRRHGPHAPSTEKDARQNDLAEKAHFVRWVAVPCLGAATVTGVGFLMLAFNELGPARELGIELFGGAMLAFLGAFLVWMLLHPFRAAEGTVLSSEWFRRAEQWLVRWPRTVIIASLAVMAVLGYATRWVKVDIDPYAFFREDSQITKALSHFAQRKFGLYLVDVVLIPKNSPKAARQVEAERAENRKVAEEFCKKIQHDRPEVRKVVSTMIAQEKIPHVDFDFNFFKSWEEIKHGFSTTWKGVKRRIAFYKAFKDWTTDRSGEDALRITFMVYHPHAGFEPLVEAVDEALPRDRFDCIRTGTAVHTVELSDGLVGGITRGLIVAAVVMSLLCAVLFRSLRLTLIAILPNAFPVLVVFGLMGALGVPLNSGSAMVATVALGVAMNDTVHFVMHYRRRRLDGTGTDEAIRETFG